MPLWNEKHVKDMSEKAFLEIYCALWEKVYSIGYTYVQDKDIAQALVRDVFVELWENQNKIKKDEAEAYLLERLKYRIYKHFDRPPSDGE